MNLDNEYGKLNFIVSTQYAIAYPEKGASIVLNKLIQLSQDKLFIIRYIFPN
jgi:hypothetical protein